MVKTFQNVWPFDLTTHCLNPEIQAHPMESVSTMANVAPFPLRLQKAFLRYFLIFGQRESESEAQRFCLMSYQN